MDYETSLNRKEFTKIEKYWNFLVYEFMKDFHKQNKTDQMAVVNAKKIYQKINRFTKRKKALCFLRKDES